MRLNGCKRLVPWGAQTDQIIVSAMINNQTELFIVPTSSPGVKIRAYRMYDGSRASDIEFSDVLLSASNRLGKVDQKTLQQIIDSETAMMCMEASSIMWAIHDQTLEYIKTREQFGQTLGSMQALQHRIVDIYIQCQLCQSMAEDAISAMCSDSLNGDHYHGAQSKRVSAAKSFIGENGRSVGKEGIQLHGGIGMTNDIPIGHYFKRLCAIDSLNGNAAWHRNNFQNI